MSQTTTKKKSYFGDQNVLHSFNSSLRASHTWIKISEMFFKPRTI